MITSTGPMEAFAATDLQNCPDPANDIIFCDDPNTAVQCTELGNTVVLSGNDNIEKIYNYFISKGLKPFQAAGIMGNMSQESGYIPDRQQDGSTWPSGGWGLIQWTGARRRAIEAAIKEKGLGDLYNPAYMNQKTPADRVDALLTFQLDYVWFEFQGDEKKSYDAILASTNLTDATIAFHDLNERSPDSREYVIENRVKPAQGILDKLGGGATSGTADPTSQTILDTRSSCGSDSSGGDGAVQGNIVKTALNYAWDTKGHGKDKSDAKDTYQAALPKFNGSTGYDEYSDCGVFVATVLRASGADKDYAVRGTGAQSEYLRKSSKFTRITASSTADLKPGDVFVITGTSGVGHTYLYTGPYKGGDGETYNTAEASLGGHVPEPGNVRFSDYRGNYQIYRLK